MDKCFTGQERKYIKSDYLHRKDVLEYVIFRVLNMNYYTLSESSACKDILNEYKEFNDPVRQFWNEFKDKFVWDLLPISFLYDLYQAWYKRNAPSGTELGKTKFNCDLKAILSSDDSWQHKGKLSICTSNRMSKREPLIRDYNLTNWTNKLYRGDDPDVKYRPVPLSENYRGLLRK